MISGPAQPSGDDVRGSGVPGRSDPVDAATVVLVRDGRDVAATGRRGATSSSIEVLMLERHLDSDAFGGALVFPGGKVDPADRELDAARWTGPAMSVWRERLGASSSADALGLLTAAARETFEEAGVLLGCREDGTPLTADDLASRSFVEARRRLNVRGERWDWRRWLDDEGLTLAFGKLALWSWWLTPAGQHRRFDTRFLLAVLPRGQVARPDGVETTSLRWTRPQAALDLHDRGEAKVIFPTRHNLRDLSSYRTATDAWLAARERQDAIERVEPRIVDVEGRTLVQHPDGGPPEPV